MTEKNLWEAIEDDLLCRAEVIKKSWEIHKAGGPFIRTMIGVASPDSKATLGSASDDSSHIIASAVYKGEK